MQETLYLMVTLLDQYLSEVPIKKNEMQLVKELISISDESYTRDQVLGMAICVRTIKGFSFL
ncbi:putative cyclin [Rosa chinensis]|uniref:Putative cyclin n=1 Tax=Rosa chinensis TaxID=74649 RepID=A0A2P6P634_ROSCH|nr:putative cyclin [Rosa chinensis]